MFHHFLKSIVILVGVSLVACSSSNGPVVIREVGEKAVVSVPPKPKTGQNSTVASRQKITPTIVRPATSSSRPISSLSPLQQQLLKQSQKKLVDREPKQAIVLAERGLRIDRKEPRFYEVLAAAYHMLGDSEQSMHFARQGLRYAKPESDDYRRLQTWLP